MQKQTLKAKGAFKITLDSDFRDVYFVCSGNQKVKAHQSVLAVCSEFLKNIFVSRCTISLRPDSGLENEKCERITLMLPDFTSDELKKALVIIYRAINPRPVNWVNPVSSRMIDLFKTLKIEIPHSLLEKPKATTKCGICFRTFDSDEMPKHLAKDNCEDPDVEEESFSKSTNDAEKIQQLKTKEDKNLMNTTTLVLPSNPVTSTPAPRKAIIQPAFTESPVIREALNKDVGMYTKMSQLAGVATGGYKIHSHMAAGDDGGNRNPEELQLTEEFEVPEQELFTNEVEVSEEGQVIEQVQFTKKGEVTGEGQVTGEGPVTGLGQVTGEGPVTGLGQVTGEGPVTGLGPLSENVQVTQVKNANLLSGRILQRSEFKNLVAGTEGRIFTVEKGKFKLLQKRKYDDTLDITGEVKQRQKCVGNETLSIEPVLKSFKRELSEDDIDMIIPESSEMGKFQCKVCPKTYSNIRNYTSHVSHHKITLVTCPLCPMVCSFSKTLTDHLKQKCVPFREASRKDSFICNIQGCTKKFLVGDVFRSKYESHVLKEHTSEKNFKCNRCEFRSKVEPTMRIHMMNHTDPSKVYCNSCKTFFHMGPTNRLIYHKCPGRVLQISLQMIPTYTNEEMREKILSKQKPL